jgi:hypothetical protein
MKEPIVVFHSWEKSPERNKPCPCGSKKKYKKCCYIKDQVNIQMQKFNILNAKNVTIKEENGANTKL